MAGSARSTLCASLTRSCAGKGKFAGAAAWALGTWQTAPCSSSLPTTAPPSAPVPPVTTTCLPSSVSVIFDRSSHSYAAPPQKVAPFAQSLNRNLDNAASFARVKPAAIRRGSHPQADAATALN
ncbi:hypothetical protein MES4922_190241 [Mesorhizobium ventifaucium]|uniref:Secreted protein n=1 Tax=Mesorhizobium ventifaucium TaxID=666020 RepID=A0ABN8JHC2_9HYPH|nr:hypothetical protein MES4922_190241 [Mesorhizobium ventifaucium]